MGPTFSIIVGGMSCNARCPFCVSRMTGKLVEDGETYEYEDRLPGGGIKMLNSSSICTDPDFKKLDEVNWRNFEIAARFSRDSGSQTAMLTGKGEPTLWPNLIFDYLARLREFGFPFIELQTNGLAIARGYVKDPTLETWYKAGVTTIGISIAHYRDERNREIYLANKGKYPSLTKLIKKLHGFGFAVRLCVVGVKGYIDTPEKVLKLIHFAKKHSVEQVTFTPVNVPTAAEDKVAKEWTRDHMLVSVIEDIQDSLDKWGTRHQELPHGAVVYDVHGQNISLNNCLNQEPNDGTKLRNIIFHPDGHIRHRWDLKGAIIL